MEKQKLPNATISLVLAILSYIGCCFSYGIGGIILAIIALVLTNKDHKTYLESPELYDNYGQVKTAKILAIISIVLSALVLLSGVIAIIKFGSMEALRQWAEEMQRQQAAAAVQ